MRRQLRWALAGTAVLSIAALWVDEGPAKVVAALGRPADSSQRFFATAQPAHDPAVVASELPHHIDAMSIEPARRDIFVPVEPAAPKPAAPTAPVAPAPLPPPSPTAPPVAWRYLGAMVTPAGERLVMLARGDTTTMVQPGLRLDDGYVVEAISSDAVRLVYPPLGSMAEIPIPPAPPTPR